MCWQESYGRREKKKSLSTREEKSWSVREKGIIDLQGTLTVTVFTGIVRGHNHNGICTSWDEHLERGSSTVQGWSDWSEHHPFPASDERGRRRCRSETDLHISRYSHPFTVFTKLVEKVMNEMYLSLLGELYPLRMVEDGTRDTQERTWNHSRLYKSNKHERIWRRNRFRYTHMRLALT